MGEKVKAASAPVGAHDCMMVPLALKKTMNRFGMAAAARARPGLSIASSNGNATAIPPLPLNSARRLSTFIAKLLARSLGHRQLKKGRHLRHRDGQIEHALVSRPKLRGQIVGGGRVIGRVVATEAKSKELSYDAACNALARRHLMSPFDWPHKRTIDVGASELSRDIDRNSVFTVAPPAKCVEVLEGQPDGVHHPVARSACRRCPVPFAGLTRRRSERNARRSDHEVPRGRRDRSAKEALPDE